VTDFLAEWTGKVFVGDCLDFMAQLPSGCVAMVMWDHPYWGVPGCRGQWDEGSALGQAWRLASSLSSLVLWDYGEQIPNLWILLRKQGWHPRRIVPWVYRNGRTGPSGLRRCAEFAVWATKGETFTFDAQGFEERFDLDYLTRPGGLVYRRDGRETLRDGRFAEPRDWFEWPAQTGGYSKEARERQHPQQKPRKVFARWIGGLSQPTDLIFDPFLGSGTTAVVAERLGRRWIGCEINEQYAAMATKRILRAREQLALPIEPKPAPGIFKHEQASLGVVE